MNGRMKALRGHIYRRYVEPTMWQCRIYQIHYNLLPRFIIFQLIRFVWCLLQRVYWEYNGHGEQIRRIKRGECYERSAHVQTIHGHSKAIPTDKVRANQFITSHDQFLHPKIVLKDNVHIVDIDSNGAIFLELKHPLAHYSASKVPFLWMALGEDALRLIWLPLDSCHKLAEQLGDPSDRGHSVTYFFNSGRCGSTLMATIVDHADEQSLVLSEPPVLMALYCLKLKTRPAAFRRIVRTAVHLLLKPYNEATKVRYVIKPIFFIVNIAADIQRAVRLSKSYFIYRQPLKMIHAHERAFGPTLFFQVIRLIFYLDCWDEGQEYIGFHRDTRIALCANRYLKPTMFETCCVIWADNMINYRRQAKLVPIAAYMYDRLFESEERFCADVLRMCGSPADKLHKAMECLKHDSQDGSLFSQKLLKQRKFTTLTGEQKARVNRFCEALQLPPLTPDSGADKPAPGVQKKATKGALELLLNANHVQRLSEMPTSKNIIKPFPVQCMISSSD